MELYDIGLIGLAVMGQNLVLNMERNGFKVAVYNRTRATTDGFIREKGAGKQIKAVYSLKDLVGLLKRPRKVFLMVKAGPPVDEMIQQLKTLLQPGDLIIDGGNSFFQDTERRSREIESEGYLYIGTGVSGGEEGALKGPSIMPGGSPEAYILIEPIMKAIAAKVNGDPCVTHIGPRGSGHYVKMIHNAIEYGDMQLIAEAYDILHRGLGLSAQELHQVFSQWNEGPLSSYLIEITSDIFALTDGETGQPLVDRILDSAGQKGTGKWASQNAFDLGIPIPTINAAVEARNLSAFKREREKASSTFPVTSLSYSGNRRTFTEETGDALYASKICSYAQGLALLRAASSEYQYDLNLAEIARIWRGGCIIRARFLDDVSRAYQEDPDLLNLILAPFFREALLQRQKAWRRVLKTAIELAVPVPAMSASLAYFDSYRSSRLPANLIQAQRDYFGAHTYRRIDREGIFHTEWKK
ncbi:MAG: decarboxylating NADP(+)-dependent phosphogluconate dehydrogenase [Syntrophaceae bacterium]|nr:decarboxylating NADP(+)-dependent phosphogluconate dehydrogenase [Syntrophaceae bacterium]